jgi:predicted nuclease with TOPRIM domain
MPQNSETYFPYLHEWELIQQNLNRKFDEDTHVKFELESLRTENKELKNKLRQLKQNESEIIQLKEEKEKINSEMEILNGDLENFKTRWKRLQSSARN